MNKKRLYLWERRLASANPYRFFQENTVWNMNIWVRPRNTGIEYLREKDRLDEMASAGREGLRAPAPIIPACSTAACFAGELFLLGEIPFPKSDAVKEYFDITTDEARAITSVAYDHEDLEQVQPYQVANVLRSIRLGLEPDCDLFYTGPGEKS